MATPCVLVKKRKRGVRQEEGGSSWCKCPVGEVSELDVVPEVHDHKHKHPIWGSRDAEVPDYRRVVLFVPPVVPEHWSAVTIKTPPLSQRSREVLHSYPRAQATAVMHWH
ncbi:uncharacterized protein C8R40DRAFT_1075346 [Lentinula edodes]|uniref:uncharacterized protein n=1 Tax=Lentinula edodes TaxID=5353 RepID=UPI001E8E0F7C|nr:uncharacterized protein C8R40DRAFT_1075346 [Lentinula edodes]KAH7867778.1 hypothetical protein C8R40DRAFT_1075346 [Lentinula edodes]